MHKIKYRLGEDSLLVDREKDERYTLDEEYDIMKREFQLRRMRAGEVRAIPHKPSWFSRIINTIFWIKT